MPRFRERHLPWFGEVPVLHDGWLDKVQIIAKPAFRIIFQTEAQADQCKSNLAQSSVFQRGFGNKRNLFFTKHTHWLFNATLKFRRRRISTDIIEEVELDLSLNPTRAFAHMAQEGGIEPAQTRRYLSTLLNDDDISGPYNALAASVNMPEPLTLDRTDNIIPRPYFQHKGDTITFYADYLENVRRLLLTELNRAAGRGEVEQVNQEWMSKHCEVYWEFSTKDAVTLVKKLQSDVLPRFSRSKWRHYGLHDNGRQLPLIDGELHHNSLVLTASLGAAAKELVIYAKDPTRVRLEVRFKDNVRDTIGISRTRHLSNDITSSSYLFAKAREKALVSLSRLINEISSTQENIKSPATTFLDFVTLLAGLEYEEPLIRQTLDILLSNHRVEVTRASEQDALCRELFRRKILKRAKAGRLPRRTLRYILNKEYQDFAIRLANL